MKRHTRVFAVLNSDMQVRLATVMVGKITGRDPRYTGVLMGAVQTGMVNGVLDALQAGDIPKYKANDLGTIYSVWLDPTVLTIPPGEEDHAE